jgi:hypothetical protein
MTKAELIKLVKREGLEADTKLRVKELRLAIIEELSEEEPEEPEEEKITPESIDEMSKSELLGIVKDYDLDVEKGKSIKAFRENIKEVLFEPEDEWGDDEWGDDD